MASKRALSEPSGSASSSHKSPRVDASSSRGTHFGSPQIRIGTSGYYYNYWCGPYYPTDLKAKSKKQFEWFSSEFDCVEINATYYVIAPEQTWRGWKAQAPRPSFTYAIKANKYFTDEKQLLVDDGFKEQWKTFWGGCLLLDDHLGPVLFVCPPSFRRNIQRLKDLSTVLPSNGRFAFEFRHPSWYTKEVYDVLRANDWCLARTHLINEMKSNGKMWAAQMDSGWHPPASVDSCCSWGLYFRLHGARGRCFGSYDSSQLQEVARRMQEFTEGSTSRKAYCLFNNDSVEPHSSCPPPAVADARNLDDLCKRSVCVDPELAEALRLSLETHQQALLPPPEEPTSGPTCAVQIRLPSGARITRKFAPSHTIKGVFHWLEREDLSGIVPRLSMRGTWSLVVSFAGWAT
ncbi:unnamed protein product [Vitrella brassicaformis CCMP3155]|uniref:UBX domain-containing protein n=1 Tax=Vitrella brassicaformis (strain CCMP3155) TaxID=1169540 RepID=A0A0G4EU00_VITBC|nr:unnamed protein product [Vitrella brassicaformis CCMP3155]|eukprot:CEM01865.1 unnamed protein product [Vitrella brassicaformis CCMP3155]